MKPTWVPQKQSSKARISNRGHRAANRAGNASGVARSTDRFVADSLNRLATANTVDIANTAGIGHPSMDHRMGYMAVPGGRECLRRANQEVRLPTKMLSSNGLLSKIGLRTRRI